MSIAEKQGFKIIFKWIIFLPLWSLQQNTKKWTLKRKRPGFHHELACSSSTSNMVNWVMHFPTEYTYIKFINCFMKNYLHMSYIRYLPVLWPLDFMESMLKYLLNEKQLLNYRPCLGIFIIKGLWASLSFGMASAYLALILHIVHCLALHFWTVMCES